jgi:hypothetical protein
VEGVCILKQCLHPIYRLYNLVGVRMLMKRAGIIGAFIAVVILGPSTPAQEITARQIFEKVKNAYASLETYQDEGTVSADLDSPGRRAKMETSFSIRVKKPNLYLISWTQSMGMPGMSQSGAVWSDGTQPYLYMANSYSKMTGDKIALAAATGISGGAAFTIPALFLPPECSVFDDVDQGDTGTAPNWF